VRYFSTACSSFDSEHNSLKHLQVGYVRDHPLVVEHLWSDAVWILRSVLTLLDRYQAELNYLLPQSTEWVPPAAAAKAVG